MLHPDNTLALLIDIQERLTPVLHRSADWLADCTTLLQGLQALSVPVMLTEQYPKGLGKTVPPFADMLADAPLFEKTRFSAWTDEVASAVKAQKNIENIIVFGCETHVCVLQTVLDLRQQGYAVYLPQECVSSRTEANKLNGLQQCAAAGAVVSNVESVLFQLLQDAKHPAFKTVSKLIV